MKQLLEKLSKAFGPSGREGCVRQVIADAVRPYVDEMRVDTLGNLIACRHGTGKRVMLAAHMDQIGFMVTDIDDKGFLRLHPIGGLARAQALNRRVVFENGQTGVIGRETEGETDPGDRTLAKLFLDIGANSRADALTHVQIGDMAVFAPDFAALSGNLVSGVAFDNRTGCAVLISALEALQQTNNEIVAVFTTQEEVGTRGATAAAYDVNPDVALAIDVTLTGDTPKAATNAVVVGKGPAIKIKDASLIASPVIVEALERIAEAERIPYQREVLTFGGTDAHPMQITRSGVATGAVSLPCRYVHSPVETVSLDDLTDAARLVAAFADQY